jgi:HEAT repeat protein
MGLFGPPNVDKLRDKRDLKGLAKALADDDAGVRDDAARAFGDLGDPAAAKLIVERMIGTDDEAKADSGGAALRAIGDAAVPELVDGLRHAPADKRPAYGAFLARMGETGVPALLEASSDADPLQRAGAALSLGLVGTPSATERLVDMYRADDEMQVRGMAMLGLANNKLPVAYDTFVAALGGDDPLTRALGAMGLGALGDPRGADPLRRAAGQDPDDRVRGAAQEALDGLPG